MHSSRNIAIIVVLLVALAGCTQEGSLYPGTVHAKGTWVCEQDTILIGEFNGSVAVTFNRQIASPMQGAITLPYTYGAKGDTLWLYSGNLYPDIFFTGTAGYIEDVAEGPAKGTFKPMVKLCR